MECYDLNALADEYEAHALEGAEGTWATDLDGESVIELGMWPMQGEFEAAGGEARHGMDWQTHSLVMGEVARRLQVRGLRTRLVPLDPAIGEPTYLHELSAKERGED